MPKNTKKRKQQIAEAAPSPKKAKVISIEKDEDEFLMGGLIHADELETCTDVLVSLGSRPDLSSSKAFKPFRTALHDYLRSSGVSIVSHLSVI